MEEYKNKKFLKVKVETPKLLPVAKQVEIKRRFSTRDKVPSMDWSSSAAVVSLRESSYSSQGPSPV